MFELGRPIALIQAATLDFVLWGFVILTSVIVILAITKNKPKPPPRPPLAGPPLLTIAGKIANPNRATPDLSADTMFKKHNIYFTAAVEFDLAALAAMEKKKVEFKSGEAVTAYEGPELKTVLANAGSADYTLVFLSGSTKPGQALQKALLDAQVWIVALTRNGKALGSGDDGPLLLINHPGTAPEKGVPEDRSKWMPGLFFVEAK
jgi:hypothetical protein